jgi:ABC-type transport system involved in multi-copper enzyme maturation permease subunit
MMELLYRFTQAEFGKLIRGSRLIWMLLLSFGFGVAAVVINQGLYGFTGSAAVMDQNLTDTTLRLMLVVLLPLFMFLLGSDLTASEFKDGTVKNILNVPLSRESMYLGKGLAGWLAAALVVFSIVVPTFIGSLVFEGLGAFSAFGASLAGVAVAILLCGWMLLFANSLSIWTGNSGTGLLLAVVLWVVMGVSGFLVPEVQRFLPTSLALGNGAGLSFSGLSMLLACYIIVTIMGMYAFQRKEF